MPEARLSRLGPANEPYPIPHRANRTRYTEDRVAVDRDVKSSLFRTEKAIKRREPAHPPRRPLMESTANCPRQELELLPNPFKFCHPLEFF